jgi:hypothetical protein
MENSERIGAAAIPIMAAVRAIIQQLPNHCSIGAVALPNN